MLNRSKVRLQPRETNEGREFKLCLITNCTVDAEKRRSTNERMSVVLLVTPKILVMFLVTRPTLVFLNPGPNCFMDLGGQKFNKVLESRPMLDTVVFQSQYRNTYVLLT